MSYLMYSVGTWINLFQKLSAMRIILADVSYSFLIFNNYSSRPKAEWAIDSEATRARGIIVLVKSN